MVSIDRYLPILSSAGLSAAAGPPPWTPLNLDLDEWQKADAGIVAADGAQFTPWSDQSGNTADQSQPTGTLQPTYHVNGLNGMPIVSYNKATSQYTQSTLNANSVPEIAIAWVWRPNMLFSLGLWSWATQVNDSSPFIQARVVDSGDISVFTSGQLFSEAPQTHLSANAWILNWDGSMWSLYKDGALLQSAAGGGADSPRGQFIFLANANTGYGTVDYAEFIVSKLALTATDISNLSTYFRNRWGTP